MPNRCGTVSAPARPQLPADPVLAAAVRWKALLASGDLSAEDQCAFESWKSESVSHAVASDLVDAKVAVVRDAITADDMLDTLEARLAAKPASSGRPLIIASPQRCETLRAGRDVATAPGDIIDLVGDDGSYIRLPPSSQVSVAYEDGVWTLDLRSGTMFVSRSQNAPGTMLVVFPADFGGVLRVERGTEATIEIRATEVDCVVASGRCVVTTDDNDHAIEAGFGSAFNRHRDRPKHADLDEAFDWVENRLIADARPLHAVIDRMRPLSLMPIVVEKALEDRPIDGEYQPCDTEASLRRIADYLKTTLHCSCGAYTLGNPAGG